MTRPSFEVARRWNARVQANTSTRSAIRVQTSSGTFETLTVVVSDAPPWRLGAFGMGFLGCIFEGEDLFEALIAFRLELEKTGCRLLCNGGRVDATPSGMSRDIGGARKVYITRMGRQATELVDVFDAAEPDLVGTVEQQHEHHARWIRSLGK